MNKIRDNKHAEKIETTKYQNESNRFQTYNVPPLDQKKKKDSEVVGNDHLIVDCVAIRMCSKLQVFLIFGRRDGFVRNPETTLRTIWIHQIE